MAKGSTILKLRDLYISLQILTPPKHRPDATPMPSIDLKSIEGVGAIFLSTYRLKQGHLGIGCAYV